MRKPAWVKRLEQELAEAGVTNEGLRAVQESYKAAGLNLSRVDGRGWRVFGIHPSLAVTYQLWADLGSLVREVESIIGSYEMKCAEKA